LILHNLANILYKLSPNPYSYSRNMFNLFHLASYFKESSYRNNLELKEPLSDILSSNKRIHNFEIFYILERQAFHLYVMHPYS
jgi:hypothetical protein